MKGVSGDEGLANIWTKGLSSFSELNASERTRYAALLGQYMQIGESFHKQHAMSKLDPGIWIGFDARHSFEPGYSSTLVSSQPLVFPNI